MGWAEVFSKLLDFLQKPTGLGTLVLVLIFLFALYLTPVAVLTWINYDGTNRIVEAIDSLKESRLARVPSR